MSSEPTTTTTTTSSTAHHHGETKVDELTGLKIALIFILFAIVFAGLIPAFSKSCHRNKVSLSLMNCFAGGTFLSMAFMHILPEAVETYFSAMTEIMAHKKNVTED